MVEKDLLRITQCGLGIYAHILGSYYPGSIVLELSGSQCKTTLNPFNRNRLTLNISCQEQMFCHQDTELPEFKGNPFDFAALHYCLKGDELLQKINEELNLHLGEERSFYDKTKNQQAVPDMADTLPRFSYFRCPISNTQPHAQLTIPEIYRLIKGLKYMRPTVELRSIQDAESARKYKAANFDYVTFSGVFSKRSDACLLKHSGLLTLDFDHVANLGDLKETLLGDPYFETELLFVSPSGNGLKWIIEVDLTSCSHQEWFASVASYLKKQYQLEVDKSGKDISRACFLPHDPEVYMNPDYL